MFHFKIIECNARIVSKSCVNCFQNAVFAVLSATTGTIGKEVGFRYDFGVFFVRPLFVIVLSNKLSIYGGHLFSLCSESECR